jgi:hypothetical protein
MYIGNALQIKTTITTVKKYSKNVQIKRNSEDNISSKACQFQHS